MEYPSFSSFCGRWVSSPSSSREEEPNPLARVSTRDPKKEDPRRGENPKSCGGKREEEEEEEEEGATTARGGGGTKKTCGMGRVKENEKFVRFSFLSLPTFPSVWVC